LLGVAIAAIDRPSLGGLKGYLGLYTAIGAGNSMHLSGACGIAGPAPAPGCPALGAASGIVLKSVRLIELLLTGSEREFLSAITTAKGFLFESHDCTSFLMCPSFSGAVSEKIPLVRVEINQVMIGLIRNGLTSIIDTISYLLLYTPLSIEMNA
jgi:hypothetical protein